VNSRDALRQIVVDRQDDVCVVCGRGMYGDSAVHEAIIKRSDLPDDARIFVPINCVALHNGCHENTKRVDTICRAYLTGHYGARAIKGWILSLNMIKIPPRARVFFSNQD